MYRVIVLISLFLIIACSDTTGPSFQQYSRISVIDTSTGSIVANIELSPTINRKICLTPDGRYAYIAAWDGDHVIQIDCLSYSISGGLDFGTYRSCMDLCTNDQGTKLYAVSDADLFIVDIPSLTLADSVQLHTPITSDIALRPGTDLVYILFMGASLSGTLVIDLAQGDVVDTLSHMAMYPAFSETGNELYIADGTQLICLDPDTDEEIASADLGKMITDICIVPGSNTMYVSWATYLAAEGGVLALDRNTLAVTNSLDLACQATNLCYIPVLDILYIGYSGGLYDSNIMVVDLPDLDPLDDIQINPNLMNMVSDPSGDYVYCNIYMDNRTGSI
jgi:outer membrane protein assembly factor BamB